MGCAALQRREVTLAVLAPVCVTEATKCRPQFLVLLQMFLGPCLSLRRKPEKLVFLLVLHVSLIFPERNAFLPPLVAFVFCMVI